MPKPTIAPGDPCWIDLSTSNVETSREFYASLFGWTYEEEEFGEAGIYTIISIGGNTVGGLLDISGRVPEEVPNHWLVYFAVDDANATLATVREKGGNVAFGPTDIPRVGRTAVVQDPFGAAFAVLQPDPEMEAAG